jgi:N-acetylneuraminic acid mutarotase
MRRIAPVLVVVVVWGCGGQDTAPPPEWKPGASIPAGPRQETAVVALGELVYVIGGFDGDGNIVATVEAYYSSAEQWLGSAPLPVPAHHVNAAVVDGKIYVVGLLRGNGFTAAGLAYAYDPINDEWTERASMPAGSERGASGVAVIGDKIYVGGGLRGGAAVADLSVYDTKNDTWESLPALPEPRDHLVAAATPSSATDSRVVFIGGRQGGIGTHSPRVFIYDATGSSWSEGTPMPTSRGGMAAAVIDQHYVVVAGGEGNAAAASGVFPQVEIYHLYGDVWDVLPPMRTPRHGTGGAAVGNVLFVVPGGATSEGFGAVATVEWMIVPYGID